MTNQDLIRRFLDMLASERGASANTLSAYRSDLEDAGAVLAKAGVDLVSVDTEALRDFLQTLQKKTGVCGHHGPKNLGFAAILPAFVWRRPARG